jgi:anti-sigma factor RsiW
MKNFREIEQLSSYLDGQLSSSESKRLEARIASDPELASAFNDLRAARGILRKLPARKAPRNFTLTRQMVGLKPPLPRSYSFFRFSTAFATVLFALTFAANLLGPRLSYVGPLNIGSGGGYGGGLVAPQAAAPEMMGTEVPVASEAPAAAAEASVATEAPAGTEAPLAEAPALKVTAPPTEDFSADTTAPEAPTAEAAGTLSEPQDQSRVQNEAPVSIGWQIALLVLGLVSGIVMLAMRRSAKQKWQ